jgi:hypothetical protein
MKEYCGSESITSLILDLGTRWRWVISFTPRPLYLQGRSPWYPLDRRLGGSQSRSGRGGEEKFPASAGYRTLEPRSSSPSPALYRLSYHGSRGKLSLGITKHHTMKTYREAEV